METILECVPLMVFFVVVSMLIFICILPALIIFIRNNHKEVEEVKRNKRDEMLKELESVSLGTALHYYKKMGISIDSLIPAKRFDPRLLGRAYSSIFFSSLEKIFVSGISNGELDLPVEIRVKMAKFADELVELGDQHPELAEEILKGFYERHAQLRGMFDSYYSLSTAKLAKEKTEKRQTKAITEGLKSL